MYRPQAHGYRKLTFVTEKLQILLALALGCVAHAQTVDTLAKIRASGTLTCATNEEEAEFSNTDDHGSREAFDADLCKSLAVAILGHTAKTALLPYPDDRTAMEALRKGEVDLIATQTDDFTHAAQADFGFSRPVLYDGLTLMVPRASSIAHVKELSGRKICFLTESEIEVSLRAWFTRERLNFVPFPFQEEGEMEAAFATNNCAALAGDATRLANTRRAFGKHADDYILLPDLLAKDPLAISYRSADTQLGRIVNWTVEALIEAEELGVTASTVDTQRKSTVEAISRLLGTTHELGTPLALAPDWAANVLKATGNYGEIFDRDLGPRSPMKLQRGPNELWTHGGLMYALPIK